MTPPTLLEQVRADLEWYWYRTRNAMLPLFGFCPACPKRPFGVHKFGCSRRPGRGLRFSVRRDPRPWKIASFDKPDQWIDEYATEDEAREALRTTYGDRWDLGTDRYGE